MNIPPGSPEARAIERELQRIAAAHQRAEARAQRSRDAARQRAEARAEQSRQSQITKWLQVRRDADLKLQELGYNPDHE